MPISSITSSKIIFSPLNWGLGHVSRTISIIHTLLENKNEIIICCDENQDRFYRDYFPQLQYVSHKGYPLKFSGKGRWTYDILKNIVTLNRYLSEERKRVEVIVNTYNPDLIVSDQRYGFISPKVKSIFITHQLTLPVSKWNFIAQIWNRRLINAFNEVWIPDTPSQKYSGKLSNGKFKHKKFIGICSRFQLEHFQDSTEKFTYSYLGIVSGPQPYSKQLLHLLIEKLKGEKALIIVPKELYQSFTTDNPYLQIIASPDPQQFAKLLRSSETVISRSGYSTIMDLATTHKRAILIPTPGQMEQSYLAQLHRKALHWKFVTEKEFLNLNL